MKVIQKSGAWLWALLAALLLTVLLTATAFAGDNDFRCWTVDARQWTNQGCRSEQDGVWYLFLPRDESPADTVLSFSGRVTAASAGALDREGGTLTGAFADRDRVTLTPGGRQNRDGVPAAEQSAQPAADPQRYHPGPDPPGQGREVSRQRPGADGRGRRPHRRRGDQGPGQLHLAGIRQKALPDQVQQKDLRAGYARPPRSGFCWPTPPTTA